MNFVKVHVYRSSTSSDFKLAHVGAQVIVEVVAYNCQNMWGHVWAGSLLQVIPELNMFLNSHALHPLQPQCSSQTTHLCAWGESGESRRVHLLLLFLKQVKSYSRLPAGQKPGCGFPLSFCFAASVGCMN